MTEMAHMVGSGDCKSCAGCGYVANDDERSPWTHWASLPPGADLAVRMGIVKRETCTVCGGTGNVRPQLSLEVEAACAVLDSHDMYEEAEKLRSRARREDRS